MYARRRCRQSPTIAVSVVSCLMSADTDIGVILFLSPPMLILFPNRASVPIQHFMAYRIMRFSGSKLLFAFISLLSWAQAALAVTSAIQGVINTSIESHKKIIPFADAWLALSACCDVAITTFLLWYLLKSRTGFESECWEKLWGRVVLMIV